MNQNQRFWVRLSQGGQVIRQVEVLSLREALKHSVDSFAEVNARKVRFVIEIANEPLSESLLSREQLAEHELMANPMEDLNEVIYPPDVTLREVQEAFASEEGQLMFQYQNPDSRVGVPTAVLETIKHNYESKFPRVAPHAPKWS